MIKNVSLKIALYFLISLILGFLPFLTKAYAQTIRSDKVTTTFGNAPSTPSQTGTPGSGGTVPLGSNGDLLRAATDLYTAYKNCTGQDFPATFDSLNKDNNSAKKSCLIQQLGPGYSATIGGFQGRYHPGILPDGCVQCLGFVALSITLVSGNSNAMNSGNAGSYYNAKDITSGGTSFLPFTASSTAPIQPGDIGIAPPNPGKEGIGSAGHALIVKSINPKFPGQFTGIESSFPNTCYLNQTWGQHLTEVYRYFRKDKV